MKGIMFLDDNFKEVDLPKETCTKEEFKDFIHKVWYICFVIPERMNWFKTVYSKHDEMNSIFMKTKCGVYSYDWDDDYWFYVKSDLVSNKVYNIYLRRQQHEL